MMERVLKEREIGSCLLSKMHDLTSEYQWRTRANIKLEIDVAVAANVETPTDDIISWGWRIQHQEHMYE